MALRFSAAAAPDVGHGRPNLIRRVLITLPLSPMLAELTNECFLPAEPSQLAPVNCRRGAGAGFPVGRSERPDRVEPPRSEATGRRSGSGVFAAGASRAGCSSLWHHGSAAGAKEQRRPLVAARCSKTTNLAVFAAAYRIGSVPHRLSSRPPSAIAMTTKISSLPRRVGDRDRDRVEVRDRPRIVLVPERHIPVRAGRGFTFDPINALPPPTAARIGLPEHRGERTRHGPPSPRLRRPARSCRGRQPAHRAV
jgi:hypothetical protein